MTKIVFDSDAQEIQKPPEKEEQKQYWVSPKVFHGLVIIAAFYGAYHGLNTASQYHGTTNNFLILAITALLPFLEMLFFLFIPATIISLVYRAVKRNNRPGSGGEPEV